MDITISSVHKKLYNGEVMTDLSKIIEEVTSAVKGGEIERFEIGAPNHWMFKNDQNYTNISVRHNNQSRTDYNLIKHTFGKEKNIISVDRRPNQGYIFIKCPLELGDTLGDYAQKGMTSDTLADLLRIEINNIVEKTRKDSFTYTYQFLDKNVDITKFRNPRYYHGMN